MLTQKKADLASFVAPFSFDPELQQVGRPLFTQRDALGPTQMIVWVARSGFLQQNRAAMIDFLEDSVRVVRWYLDPKNHNEAVQIAAKITKLRPELFAGWLFTNKEYSRSPDLLPDLAALQSNIDVQRDLGFLKGPIDVQKYADLSLVREAAHRRKCRRQPAGKAARADGTTESGLIEEMRMPPVASAVGRTAKRNIDAAEWEQRVNLAACYRLVEHFGWTDLIYTHISARVPGVP